jgi:hypothetical protein
VSPPDRKLRIGLLLDGTDVPAWFFEMVARVHGGPHADVCLVVENAANGKDDTDLLTRTRRRGPIENAGVALRKLLELIYDRWIDQPGVTLRDAFEPRDIRQLLPDVPWLSCEPEQTRYSDRIRPEDLEKIRRHEPDLLIRLGFRILRGDILTLPPMGVWSYHHGDNRSNRGGPAGFWETMLNLPVTGVILQVLNEDLDNGVVLYRSCSVTNPMSVTNNRNNCYWKSALFVERVLERVRRQGFETTLQRCEESDRSLGFYAEPLFKVPTNRVYLRLLLRKLGQKVKNKVSSLIHLDQWILLYHWREDLSSSLWRYQKLLPPKDRFWADPHVIERDGRYYVFFEEYVYDRGKAHISMVEFDQDGPSTAPVTVLEEPHHLSYPFVFEHDGEVYLIPEASESGRIDLYRANRFPFEWEVHETLISDVRAVDATLLRHQGRWWLFANVAAIDGMSSNDELHVYCSDALTGGDWRPHPMNPVVSDCRQARPAGRIFEQDGRLYRPSQNCSWRYGYGFNFSEITALTPETYEETVVDRVTPNWDDRLIATHTFNRCGPLHLADGMLRRSRWRRG